VLAVSGVTGAASALIGYTSSRPWPFEVAPPVGIFSFDREAASTFGQARAFVMDLRRLALVPVTTAWFPRLDRPDHGVQGHVPKAQQRRFRETAFDLVTRRGEIVERLGPLWPGGQR